MKRLHTPLALACIPGIMLLSAPSIQAQTTSLTSREQVERAALVRDVAIHDRTVSGVVVNTSPRLLRDVKLLISHTWHWKDERHPGDDSPGRTESVTVPGEVAPGHSLPFTAQLDQPLPERTDGNFATSAEVIGFSEVGD
jgi:hypothetical protein